MNLFLGPVPDSPIGARLFEVAFPPRMRRATDRVPVYPRSNFELRSPVPLAIYDWADRDNADPLLA